MSQASATAATGAVAVAPPRADGGRGWLVALLLVLHAALCWLSRPAGIETRQDDATHVLLAESLRQGAYEQIWEVDPVPHRRYPPAYSAAVALWGAVFGDGYDTLVMLSIACSTAALAILFVAVRRAFSVGMALAVVSVLAVNPFIAQYGGSIASETPFSLLILVSVGLLATPAVSRGRSVGAGAAAIGAALTRVAGIPILVAVSVHWLLQRKWKRVALFAVASLATVGAWMMWSASAPVQFEGGSYFVDLTAQGGWQAGPWSMLRRVARKVPFYLGRSVPWLLGTPTAPDTPIDNVIAAAVASITLLAGVVVLFRRWRAAALALIAYAGMLLLWPWNHERFLMPMMVLVVPTMLAGFGALGRLRNERTGRFVLVAATAFLVVTGALRTGGEIRRLAKCDRSGPYPPPACVRRDEASFFAALDHVVMHTAEDAVFLNLKPEPFYLYTRRKTVPTSIARINDPQRFLQAVREADIDYALLGSLQAGEPRRLALMLEANCTHLEPVGFFPARTWLFRFLPDARDTGNGCEAMRQYRIANLNRAFGVDP